MTVIHDEYGKIVTIDTNHTILYEYSGSNLIYMGKARVGSGDDTDKPIWQIRKYTYSGSNITSMKWADGDANYDNIWDDRVTLSYS